MPDELSERETELDLARATGTCTPLAAIALDDTDGARGLTEEASTLEEPERESPRTREEKEGSATVIAFECLCCAWCSSVWIFSCFLRSWGRLKGLLQTSQTWGFKGVWTEAAL